MLYFFFFESVNFNIFFPFFSSKAGKVTDRAQLLVLFKSDMISPLFQAVEAANLKTMQGEDDQHYLFLKRMVQLLVELGGQVCGIWHEKNSSKPENFNIYLNALLAFTNHNSHTVNYYANELWAKFCRHVEISKDDVFQTFIPKWVECALKKVILSIFYILNLPLINHIRYVLWILYGLYNMIDSQFCN